ncbi:MAG: peptide ABC transporter substrate-binding protein [Opitutales bacterium]|nr:peptide ABC transporter substrate-binding protein [Opitutales bacterium]NRA27050.1 peptide ABC transporter substrate-binding protein [Opitutales bacterium]
MLPRLRALLALTLIPFLTHCGGPSGDDLDSGRKTKADEAAATGILLRGNGNEPQGLDPHVVTGVPENKIISALMEGLISYHPTDDNEPEPGVAERWESNEDGSKWTFYLRKDALWSNGDPVTAKDFVYSWNRMLHPVFGAKYADMLYILENGAAYHQERVKDFSEVGVKALDAHTLEVTLNGPTPYFLSKLKHYSWFPVHPETIEKFGGMLELDSAWTRENYVGNGPFVLAEWTPDEIIRVAKSPTYWDSETVQLNEIHFFPITQLNTEERAFAAGELHTTDKIPPEKISVYLDENPELIHLDPWLGVYFYRFNIERPPFDDVRVRRALAMTIDREVIVRRISQGGEQPADGFTPPGIKGYEPPRLIPYDPEAARALLAEAGYAGGEGWPEGVEILFNTLESHRDIATAIQSMWETELGIQVGILNQEWKVYINSQQTLDYSVSRAGWIGDYMDPTTFLSMWTTGNGNNNTGWSNAEFDRLILEDAVAETDLERRLEILHRAETILLNEAPVAPIYWYTRKYLRDPRLKGFYPKLLDNRPYKYLHF